MWSYRRSHPRGSHKLHIARMLRQVCDEREEERNRQQREDETEQDVSDCEEEDDEEDTPRYFFVLCHVTSTSSYF